MNMYNLVIYNYNEMTREIFWNLLRKGAPEYGLSPVGILIFDCLSTHAPFEEKKANKTGPEFAFAGR